MATEADYQVLNEKIRALEQERAVLEAQEKIKAEKRNELLKELSDAGIDIEHLPEEAARLQREIDADYAAAEQRVSDYEKSLRAVLPETEDRGIDDRETFDQMQFIKT